MTNFYSNSKLMLHSYEINIRQMIENITNLKGAAEVKQQGWSVRSLALDR
jgi:hypothetical protein